MFGFIEAKLAQILNIPYEPFQLNDGGIAAMIARRYYIRVLRALTRLHDRCLDIPELMPIDKESDVVGMRVILHKYYYDDRVLDGLTTGEIKETESYTAIKNEGDGEQRFDSGKFETEIGELYLNEPEVIEETRTRTIRPTVDPVPVEREDEETEETEEQPSPTAVVRRRQVPRRPITPENIPVEEENKPVKKTDESLIQETLDKLDSLGFGFYNNNDGKFRISTINCLEQIQRNIILDLADSIKRHIIIGDNARHLVAIKKHCDTKILSKYFLIILTNPDSQSNDFVHPAVPMKSIAFGREINNLYIVKGVDVNKELEKIKNLTSLNKEEKEEKINKIMMEGRNSPYAKYDKIYKDTITNIVFAVQDKYVLSLLLKLNENVKFILTIFNEINRRFNGTVSYSELLKIDFDYQSILEKENREEYSKFTVENSSSIIHQLKKAYEDSKKAYEDYLTKAMESGKMCSKYMEQIEVFNQEDQQAKLKKKAYDEYDAVRAIPQISTIYIENDKVNIYTKNLYARDDRTKKLHDIGTFHISIGMHSNTYDTNNTVVIKNTKHQIVAFNNQIMQAPHVFPEGYICHGTLATGMANSYKKRDLYQLIYQLILFLSQANTDDAAGKYVNKWPEVDESILKAQEEKQSQVAEVANFTEVPENKEFDEVFATAIPV